MALTEKQIQIQNENLLRTLDRGIDDMEAKREMPLDDAFRQIIELREKKRSARI